jgi:hypothetical protein
MRTQETAVAPAEELPEESGGPNQETSTRRRAGEARIEDIKQRMVTERNHQIDEWRARRKEGTICGEVLDSLLSDFLTVLRQRDAAKLEAMTTDLQLQEAREDLAYRAVEYEDHRARINELTAMLAEHHVEVPRKQFQPGRGLHDDRRAPHKSKKRG